MAPTSTCWPHRWGIHRQHVGHGAPTSAAANARRAAKRGPYRPRKAGAAVDAKLAAKREKAKLWARRKRHAAREAKVEAEHGARNGAGNGHERAAKPAIGAAQLWEHAARLSPKTPWRAAAREFGTNEAQTLDAYRSNSLPPGITANAIERFLELPAP
jgi:hypothetical protein